MAGAGRAVLSLARGRTKGAFGVRSTGSAGETRRLGAATWATAQAVHVPDFPQGNSVREQRCLSGRVSRPPPGHHHQLQQSDPEAYDAQRGRADRPRLHAPGRSVIVSGLQVSPGASGRPSAPVSPFVPDPLLVRPGSIVNLSLRQIAVNQTCGRCQKLAGDRDANAYTNRYKALKGTVVKAT